MSLVDKLLPKDKPSEYFLLLKVGISSVAAVVWEVKNKKIVITGRSEQKSDVVHSDVHLYDSVISEAEATLPPHAILQKVIFGLPLDFIEQAKIKHPILVQLKRLTQKLSLLPLGFIELPEALAHYLRVQEHAPTSAILLGLTPVSLTASLLRVGRIIESKTVARTEAFAQDVESTIKQLSKNGVLPSRILLYDEGENLDKLQELLIKYPWHQKNIFLHVPKIEIIGKDDIIHALVESAASEMLKTVTKEEFDSEDVKATSSSIPAAAVEDAPEEEEEEEVEPQSIEPTPMTSPVPQDRQPDEEEFEGAQFGFVQNQDVKKGLEEKVVEDEVYDPTPDLPQRRTHVFVKEDTEEENGFLSRLSLPHFSLPSSPNFKLFPILFIIFLIILGGLLTAAYYQIPSADVRILVAGNTLEKNMDITLSPSTSSVDTQNLTIPANKVDAQVSGEKSKQTTGKKNVGTPSKGTVTIYNKTNNSKTFDKGSLLSANGIKFTLDSDITIASASDTGEGLSYGKTDGKVTAYTIGPDSNLSPGANFTFTDSPSSSYTAKNNDALSGGTSRQISAVSKEDQDALLTTLSNELKEQAKSELMQKIPSDEKLLSDSLIIELVDKKFSKNIGEEATELSLSLTAHITGYTYKQSDISTLAKETIVNNAPAGYEYSEDSVNLKVNQSTVLKDGGLKISATVSTLLLPKISLAPIGKNIAGKPVDQVETYLRSVESVTGYEVKVNTPFPFGKKTLPLNPSNIHLTIAKN